LGRMVREAWVRWAQMQPSPKPSWLLPYDDLSEPDKEADRQIGETIARWTLIHDAARNSFCAAPPQEGGIAEVEGLIDFLEVGYAPHGDTEALMKAAAAELSRLSALVKAQKEALKRLDDAICQVKKGLSRDAILAVNELDRAGLDFALVKARRASKGAEDDRTSASKYQQGQPATTI